MALTDRNPAANSGESPDSNPAEKFEVRVPKYSLHKKINARLVLNGHEVYLGSYGTPESKANYERVVAEWLQSGRKTPKLKRPIEETHAGQPSITEVIVRYMDHAEQYYRRSDGTPTRESDNIRDAVRPLRRLFGNVRAESFTP